MLPRALSCGISDFSFFHINNMKTGKSSSVPRVDLRFCLEKVAKEFDQAAAEPFTNHPLADFIRDDFSRGITDAVGAEKSIYISKASPGMSKWADVPWGALFNPIVTRTAQSGFYIVYLFSKGGSRIYLSLMQGGTEVRNEFKAKGDYLKVLRVRSAVLRAKLREFYVHFPDVTVSLDSNADRPEFYEAAHVLGKHYVLNDGLPSQSELERDLKLMCDAYRELIFRGGIESDFNDDIINEESSVMQRREYRLHKVIERTGDYSSKAKKFHGTVCQVCAFDFGRAYGVLGEGYIEAHHLVPLSALKEGLDYVYSIERDFAVLCANCHRMIHRSGNPDDLDALRRFFKK